MIAYFLFTTIRLAALAGVELPFLINSFQTYRHKSVSLTSTELTGISVNNP